mmetsp:Transcript_14343/g.29404  ORF Transcript_14343/g.29404 Transcript_14343/m.29404 type:complete len:225 (+) Transcript_14343:261-935(+)
MVFFRLMGSVSSSSSVSTSHGSVRSEKSPRRFPKLSSSSEWHVKSATPKSYGRKLALCCAPVPSTAQPRMSASCAANMDCGLASNTATLQGARSTLRLAFKYSCAWIAVADEYPFSKCPTLSPHTKSTGRIRSSAHPELLPPWLLPPWLLKSAKVSSPPNGVCPFSSRGAPSAEAPPSAGKNKGGLPSSPWNSSPHTPAASRHACTVARGYVDTIATGTPFERI